MSKHYLAALAATVQKDFHKDDDDAETVGMCVLWALLMLQSRYRNNSKELGRDFLKAIRGMPTKHAKALKTYFSMEDTIACVYDIYLLLEASDCAKDILFERMDYQKARGSSRFKEKHGLPIDAVDVTYTTPLVNSYAEDVNNEGCTAVGKSFRDDNRAQSFNNDSVDLA